jgi:hypothetical protein
MPACHTSTLLLVLVLFLLLLLLLLLPVGCCVIKGLDLKPVQANHMVSSISAAAAAAACRVVL